MGIFRPGAPGTQVHVYDDNDGTGGHAVGSPHTWAEINAAYPVEFAIMQDAAANVFSATHRQYLCTADLMIGSPTIGATNTTTLTDTSGADIFSPNGTGGQSRLRFTTANNFNNQIFNIGTKIGTGKKAIGKQGGSIHSGGTLNIRADASVYGTFFDIAGNITFQTGSSTASEYAGCLFVTTGIFVLGTGGGSLKFYNCSAGTTSGVNLITASSMNDAYNFTFGATAPSRYLFTTSSNLKLSGMTLVGAPTVCDLELRAPSASNNAFDVTYTDTPGIPRIQTNSVTADLLDDYRTFDVKVVDPNGNALSGIPVYMETDIDGGILSAATNADGNIVFTDNPTSVDQVILVRRYYNDNGLIVEAATQDRVFTLWINSYKDAGVYAPNLGYETQTYKFEWPGRDRLGTGYQTDGGSFQKTLDVIKLAYGIPSAGTLWVERVAP